MTVLWVQNVCCRCLSSQWRRLAHWILRRSMLTEGYPCRVGLLVCSVVFFKEVLRSLHSMVVLCSIFLAKATLFQWSIDNCFQTVVIMPASSAMAWNGRAQAQVRGSDWLMIQSSKESGLSFRSFAISSESRKVGWESLLMPLLWRTASVRRFAPFFWCFILIELGVLFKEMRGESCCPAGAAAVSSREPLTIGTLGGLMMYSDGLG